MSENPGAEFFSARDEPEPPRRDPYDAPEGCEDILGRDYVRLVDRQGDLLRATVKALRGDPPELVYWSHHDVAEMATAAVEVAARWLMASQADPRLRMTKWEELTDAQKENFRSAVRAALVAEADSRKE